MKSLDGLLVHVHRLRDGDHGVHASSLHNDWVGLTQQTYPLSKLV